jgi:tungstate transport system ATP-binding protein
MSFTQEGTTLLGPIDLDVTLRGITTVLGYNGAGKSLFLELCHSMIEPSSGSIEWNSKPAHQTRRDRGYIFQHRILLRRSVRKNIALPMQAAGWSTDAINNRLEELLNMAKLTTRADDPAAILSGGEAQRMALVRALATKPQVLIMDEPTSSLDPNATAKFENLIKDVASNGVKFLWATHNITQAKRFADDIIYVADGKLTEYGPADAFFAQPKTETARRYVEGQ